MNQAVLMDANIHEGAECRDIRNYARKLHSDNQIGYLVYSFGKDNIFKLLSRIASGFDKLGHNIF